jgi:hypothetical protein
LGVLGKFFPILKTDKTLKGFNGVAFSIKHNWIACAIGLQGLNHIDHIVSTLSIDVSF